MGFVKTTALILSYNQEDCIQDAIESVVNQTLQPDEILISDDCSTDATFYRAQQVVEEVRQSGRFKGVVRLNRNEKNLGFIPHFNWAVEACSDDLILYNAGDDISMPNRLETFSNAYHDRGDPRYFLGHSSVQIKGGPQDGGIWVPPVEQAQFPIERLANSAALHIGAAQCFTKALFSDFGPIRFEDAYEDLILGFRALLTDSYWYSPKPLLTYRIGGLTFWQKNTWEKKRKRYKAVLSQRNLDALQQGRLDLVTEISCAYQDYGFTYTPHPDSFEVFSFEQAQTSLFDYYISDHFHRLPHLIRNRPFETFKHNLFKTEKSASAGKTVVLIRACDFYNTDLSKVIYSRHKSNVTFIFDLGIFYPQAAKLIKDLKFKKFLGDMRLLKENLRLVSASEVVKREAEKILGELVIRAPLLVDTDGPVKKTEIHLSEASEFNILLLAVADVSPVNLGDIIKKTTSDLLRSVTADKVIFYLPEEFDLPSMLLEEILNDGFSVFRVSSLIQPQLSHFNLVLVIKTLGTTLDESIDHVKRLANNAGVETREWVIDESGFAITHGGVLNIDEVRSGLYFSCSVQKRVEDLINFLCISSGISNKFRRVISL